MKPFILFIFFSMFSGLLLGQAPQGFKYQAVARDASGQVISSKEISMRISILAGSTEGKKVYSETHQAISNSLGLIDLMIGGGKAETGMFSDIQWSTANHFVKIEMDTKGGSDYIHMGTSQLLSVPYALHAKTVENVPDNDPTNEIQSLSITGNNLSLSKSGGTVTIPSNGSLWTKSSNHIYFNSGNVGIGTSAPSGLLTLEGGSTNSDIKFFNTATGNRQILDGLTVGISGTAPNEAWFFNRENSKIIFGTNNLERMTITADGKVGIGTNSPTATLETKGGAKISGSLEVTENAKIGGNIDATGNLKIGKELTIGERTIKKIAFNSGTTNGGGRDVLPYPEGATLGNICILTFEVWFHPVVTDSDPAAYRGIKDGIWYELTPSNIIIHYPDKTQYNVEPWRMNYMILQ